MRVYRIRARQLQHAVHNRIELSNKFKLYSQHSCIRLPRPPQKMKEAAAFLGFYHLFRGMGVPVQVKYAAAQNPNWKSIKLFLKY